MTIKKAVFPIAGLGTRFLPASKAVPKEMLQVVDKPLLQYATEEAVAAGITELIFVTRPNKELIARHFKRNEELENTLLKKGREDLLACIRDIVPGHVTCSFIWHPNSLGLGHAVLCAQNMIAGEPFAVILPDDLIVNGGRNALQQIADVHTRYGGSVIALERVRHTQTEHYGIVDIDPVAPRVGRLKDIMEKPAAGLAPSNLAVVGRYILTPRIFELLKETKAGIGGEIQLTDAISDLLKYESVHGYEIEGRRYDCGHKLGLWQANVELGLEHPEIGENVYGYLQNILSTQN
ncbi:MAG: UTP--glucose-1-phosphate uridylyltransferase [Gammaproteobacteria bacterium]|nr:UTP--glucose-1-phosphate uridylyltransferase [Gammaproteobacteria bacterium]